MARLLRRTFVQLPRAAISGRVDAGTVFRKHFADTPALVAVSSPDVGQPVALYPAGRGSAQSLRNMSLNSRRWRCPSAKSNQLVARMLHELSTGLHEPVLQTHQRPALDPLRQTDSAPSERELLLISHSQQQLTNGLGHRFLL